MTSAHTGGCRCILNAFDFVRAFGRQKVWGDSDLHRRSEKGDWGAQLEQRCAAAAADPGWWLGHHQGEALEPDKPPGSCPEAADPEGGGSCSSCPRIGSLKVFQTRAPRELVLKKYFVIRLVFFTISVVPVLGTTPEDQCIWLFFSLLQYGFFCRCRAPSCNVRLRMGYWVCWTRYVQGRVSCLPFAWNSL